VGKDLAADPEMGPAMLAPLKSAGIMAEDSALVERVKFTAHPGHEAAWTIRREAYARLVKAFLDAGIHFAHREITVHGDSVDTRAATTAAAVATDGDSVAPGRF
jgi:small-conductance mechanosensitive channel